MRDQDKKANKEKFYWRWSMSKVHDVWRQALGNKRYLSFTHVIDSWQFNCLIYLQDLCCKMGGWYDEHSLHIFRIIIKDGG